MIFTMPNLLEPEWIEYRDTCYEGFDFEDDELALDADDLRRAFFAGAITLFRLLGQHAHTDPDETVAAVRAELRAFAADIGKQTEPA